MPTELPRTQVTHTPAVQHALEVAEAQWPGERPRTLLLNLIEAGALSIESGEARRRERVVQHAAAFSGLYEPGYLERQREDWPA